VIAPPTVLLPRPAPIKESALTLTLAEADFVVSAWLVALTVEEFLPGTEETAIVMPDVVLPAVTETFCGVFKDREGMPGAVYNPELEMVPTVEFPPTILLTLQVTAVFEVPVTLAVNCLEPPKDNETVLGVMVTLTVGGGGGPPDDPPPPPPQPTARRATTSPSPRGSALPGFAEAILIIIMLMQIQLKAMASY
jgi:hypothetical protein